MQFISTKELRTSLPSIRKRLAKGEEFFLIFQSKPIAKLTPVSKFEEASDTDIELTALQDIQDDFLSKDELNYYLSLS